MHTHTAVTHGGSVKPYSCTNSEVQRLARFSDDAIAEAEAAVVTNTWLLTKCSMFFRAVELVSMFL